MEQHLTKNTTQLFAEVCTILQRHPVQKAYLFGSFARNEATQQSDIDLLVQLNYVQIITGMEFFEL